MSTVFVSHSSKDRKIAVRICAALEAKGIACWLSSRDINPGENFGDAIVNAIRAAKLMLLVFTANANNSSEIKKELVLAGQNQLAVIPVRVEDVVPGGAFAYELATRQWIDLFDDWDLEMDRLATWIQRTLKVSDGTPDPPVGITPTSAAEAAERIAAVPTSPDVAVGQPVTSSRLSSDTSADGRDAPPPLSEASRGDRTEAPGQREVPRELPLASEAAIRATRVSDRGSEAGRSSTRRRLLRGLGVGVGVAAAGAGIAVELQPGFPLWRLLNDSSIRTFKDTGRGITSVAWVPDGRTALSGSYDKIVRLWDVTAGTMIRTFLGHTDTVHSVAVSPDGRAALSGAADNTLKLWTIGTGEEIRTFAGHSSTVESVAFSPDGRVAVSGGWDRTLMVWEVATGKWLRGLIGHLDRIVSVAFSPSGRIVASASWDRAVKLWDVLGGREIRTLAGHASGVQAVAFSPDGLTLLSGDGGGTLKFWEVATGQELRTVSGHAKGVAAAAFSPDGLTALSAGADTAIRLWEVATGQPLGALTGHAKAVTSLAVARDGGSMLSCSYDDTMKLWDLRTSSRS